MMIVTLLTTLATYAIALAVPTLVVFLLIRYNDTLRRRALNDHLKNMLRVFGKNE